MFGAFHPSKGLVLVVEADNVDEAKRRVAQVAELVRVQPVNDLSIRELDDTQEGVPTFFKAYFGQPANGDILTRIGPSTRSLQ